MKSPKPGVLKMKNKFLIFLMMLFCSAANAGILIEPYVGGSSNLLNAEFISPSTFYDVTGNGTYGGGRLGYKFFFDVWVAADYTLNSVTYTINKPSTVSSISISSNYTFIDVGWDTPLFVRLYGGYGVAGTARVSGTTTSGNSISDKFYAATAFKAGIGFSFLEFFSINVEYFKPTFARYEAVTNGVSNGVQDLNSAWRTFNLSNTAVTLSFPLTIL